MGTTFKVILYAKSKPIADTVSFKTFQRIAAVNQTMSDYLPNSEVSLFSNTAGSKKKRKVSKDLFHILKQSIKWSRKTKGNFDITVGPLTKLWRKAFRQQAFPDSIQIVQCKSLVNYKNLKTSCWSQKARLTKRGMRVDLGGIGKGYAIDEAMKIIKELGIKSALVEGGGDILVSNPPPNEKNWKIQSPFSDDLIFLKNQAIATSGDSYQYLEWKGKRFSHIINPKTGFGIENQKSISVIADNCTNADALASACSILNQKEIDKLDKSKKWKIIIW